MLIGKRLKKIIGIFSLWIHLSGFVDLAYGGGCLFETKAREGFCLIFLLPDCFQKQMDIT